MLYSALAAALSPSQVASQASQAMQAQDYVKAERLYAELTHLVPNVPEVYSNLGLARYYQKKFKTGQEAFETALRLNPILFVPNFFLGKILSENERYTQALPLAEKAVAAQPENKAARRLLASVLVGLKRENQAISQYQKLIEQDPRDVESLYDLALVYLDRGESAFEQLSNYKEPGFVKLVAAERDAQMEGFQEAAADEYRRAIAVSPTVPGLRIALGNLLLKSEKWRMAGQAFQEELAVDPFSYEARSGLARVAVHEQQCDAAVRYLDEAVEIRPEFLDPLPNLVSGLSPAELQTSCSAFIKSASGHESFGAALLLWNLAEAQGQTERGASWRTQAERERDELIRSYKLRASSSSGRFQNRSERRSLGVKYLQKKRYEEGLGLLSPLLDENSEDTQVSLLVARSLFCLERFSDVLKFLDAIHLDNPEALYLRGACCKRLALQLMNDIVEIDPQSARSHQLLASVYAAQQMFPEAAREYEMALTIQPNDPELYFALGNAYFKGRKFQNAERAYARTIELNPLHAEARAMRGWALVQLTRPDEAVPLLRQALQLNPDLVSAHVILGKALAEIGQVAEAVQQLELAKTTDTDGTLHYQLSGLYRKLGESEKSKQALLASEKIRRERQQAMEKSVVLPAPEQTERKQHN
jgi:tetratricopeptide (TPR) repeat protein